MIQSTALNEQIIKRVIGLPGDTLELKDGVVYRNGEALEEPYVAFASQRDNLEEMVIPEHMLFVMGDNRQLSLDSRSPSLGLVPDGEVMGTVFFSVQLPFSLGGSSGS